MRSVALVAVGIHSDGGRAFHTILVPGCGAMGSENPMLQSQGHPGHTGVWKHPLKSPGRGIPSSSKGCL